MLRLFASPLPLVPALIALAVALAAAGTADAHEYWIEPSRYQLAQGERIEGDLKNGQDFSGATFAYIPSRFERFDMLSPSADQPVTGRTGDRPALTFEPQEPGLHVAVYRSVFDRLRFDKWETFTGYVAYEGLDWAVDRHLERGLPQTGFAERYARCAKALIQVGDADPASPGDRLTGLEFELVAEENPYLPGLQALPLRLYLDGKPVPDWPVNVFRKEQEAPLNLRTDAEGRLVLSLLPGEAYLVNAVHLFEGDEDPATDEPEWWSYWASLVFATAPAQ